MRRRPPPRLTAKRTRKRNTYRTVRLFLNKIDPVVITTAPLDFFDHGFIKRFSE